MRERKGEGTIGKEIFIFAIKWALNNVALGLRAAQIAVGSKSRTGKCCPQWAGGCTGCRVPDHGSESAESSPGQRFAD